MSYLSSFIQQYVSSEFLYDISHILLYPADISNPIILDQLCSFLQDYKKICNRNNISLTRNVEQILETLYSFAKVRQMGKEVLNYGNVEKHIQTRPVSVQNFFKNISKNQIKNHNKYKALRNEVSRQIQVFYDIVSISSNLVDLDGFYNQIRNSQLTPYETIKIFSDWVIETYGSLSKLNTLNVKEKEQDFFIISDKDSVSKFVDNIIDYLENKYNSFKVGYPLIDEIVEGLESSTVFMLSAPSNHGKSIFLINIMRNLLVNNIDNFQDGDAILFLTMEDDINKLNKRVISIFGNYDSAVVKRLYRSIRDYLHLPMQSSVDKTIVKKMMTNIITSCVSTIIKNKKINIIFKHCNENIFTPGDLGRFIDFLQVDNIKVKSVFADYIDVMAPTVNTTSFYGDNYNAQGQIVHELRLLSRMYHIPIITATQNRREAENISYTQNNNFIGDSIKKVRYSDVIVMHRMRRDLNIFIDPVKRYVFSEEDIEDSGNISPQMLRVQDQLNGNLIPFEATLTKSKDSEKDVTNFYLFCKQNLRIYSNVREYLQDVETLLRNSKQLENDLDKLLLNGVNTTNLQPFGEEINTNKIIPFNTVVNV
jgi:replicative DNA helicase